MARTVAVVRVTRSFTTAKTSEIEFEKIYNLSVEQIPTARPNLRKDLPDFIYKDSLTKWTAVARECKAIAKTKQPILIGTTTVENSEILYVRNSREICEFGDGPSD